MAGSPTRMKEAAPVPEPSPTRLVVGLGTELSRALQPLIRTHLAELGDRNHRIEVLASPLPEDAHSEVLGPDTGEAGNLAAITTAFQNWSRSLVGSATEDIPCIWVFTHLKEAAQTLTRLARDPGNHFIVLGTDPSSMAYVGSNVRYQAIGPTETDAQRQGVAAAIAVECLFRFPTPATVPILPWGTLTRFNYYDRSQLTTPPSEEGQMEMGRVSEDGRWRWDGKAWRPNTVITAPPTGLPAAPPPLPPPVTSNHRPRRGMFGRLRGGSSPPPSPVGQLILSHTPITIVVTGVKGGLGKSMLSAGLALVARQVVPPGMPLVALDSDPLHNSLSRFLDTDNQSGAVPLWDVIARHTASGELVPPAPSGAQIYVYEQGTNIAERLAMFDDTGHPTTSVYDPARFVDQLHQQYRVVVVDASSYRDIAFQWVQVADAIVVATDDSPLTVEQTQQYLSLLQYWRNGIPARAQLTIACAWLSRFRKMTPDVKQRRQRIERGFEVTISGERFHAPGVPVVDIPNDQGAYSATTFHELQGSAAMAAYSQLFALLIRSVGPARLRVG